MIKETKGFVKIEGHPSEVLCGYLCITKSISEACVKSGLSEEDTWLLLEKIVKFAKTLDTTRCIDFVGEFMTFLTKELQPSQGEEEKGEQKP